MKKSFRVQLVVSALVLCFLHSLPAVAGWDAEFFFYAPLNQNLGINLDRGTGPWHGAAALQYTEQKKVGRGNQLRVGFNTETFWLAWDLGVLSPRRVTGSVYLRGQAGFAQMTPDYLRQGQHLRKLSFFSGFGAAGGELFVKLDSIWKMEAQLEFRYWTFWKGEQTEMVLPTNSPALRAHLGVSTSLPTKLFHRGRLRQEAKFQAQMRLRRRFFHSAWGGEFVQGQKDPRNQFEPSLAAFQLYLEGTGSLCLHSRFCLRGQLSGGHSLEADDLQRFQVGGDLRYLPQVSGTYSSEFLTDTYALANLMVQWLPVNWLRVTPQVDVVVLADPRREGKSDQFGFLLGLGLSLDFFLRHNMRIHARFGYSPFSERGGATGGFKAILGFAGHWWP
jgi:hypothetical protein